MGYAVRYFVADYDGTVTRVPAARCGRWFSDEEPLPPSRAGRELLLLEVLLAVERQRVVDVLRIVPVRYQVRDDGRLDVTLANRLALKRVDLLSFGEAGETSAQIEQLEADANYFWWPTDMHLEALGTALLKHPPTATELRELRAVLFGVGDARRETDG